MDKSQALIITDRAAEQIKNLLDKRSEEACGIRVGVRKGGCSGLAYTIEYADEIRPFEEIVEQKGVKLIIDPKASLYLIGTKMDYIKETFKEGFAFVNPNEKGRCGCGESFHV